MQALYEADFGKKDIVEALDNLFSDKEYDAEAKEFAKNLAEDTWAKKNSIDSIIRKYSKGWQIERIGGVDRNILRLALHELTNTDTPPQVIINEAVELAKKFSSAEASKFINGILGAYLKELKNK